MSPEERTRRVREEALRLGFHKVGFARAGVADPEGRLRAWLDRGFAGEMDYLERTAKERADPRLVVDGAKSVIALAMSYYQPNAKPTVPLKVSRYAMSDDYHTIIRKKVRKLRTFILSFEPDAKIHPTVDTSPVLEREWAERAGIAWIGKSTMAIAPDLGTYTFLASLVTSVEFAYGDRHPDRCGTCTACLDACPTQAFVGPRELDARRCITYWNVEVRRPFDASTPPLHDWVAGCDICQEVCPWNKFTHEATEPRFTPRPGLASPDPQIFTDPDRHDALEQTLKGTPLQRTGAAAIRRNALKILGSD